MVGRGQFERMIFFYDYERLYAAAARSLEQQQEQQRQLEEARATERALQKKAARRTEVERLHEEAKAQQPRESHGPHPAHVEVDVPAQFGYSSNNLGNNADPPRRAMCGKMLIPRTR